MRVNIVIGLVVAGLLLAFVGRHFLHSLLHPGAETFYSGTLRRAPPEPHGPGIEVLSVTVAGATSESLFLPATDSAAGPKPLVIFAHGNSALIDDWLTNLDTFRQRGIGVLLVEYPGYGRSTGAPSEASIRATFDSAYDRVIADSRVDASRIIGFGQSFGGAAIGLLAQDRPLRALILMSTFTSLDVLPPGGGAIRDHYNSVPIVSRYSGPVLVIHGRKDPRIRWQQGQQLAVAAPHSTFLLYDCAHDCWHSEVLQFWRDATPFLAHAGITVAAAP
jgi:pimeloyl-ACP methyl ester carboxylesterase